MSRRYLYPLVALLLLAACARQSADGGSTIVARDLGDLTGRSDLVVLATVSAEGGTRNLARNPNNPAQEDPNIVIVGQDYLLTIESAVKGEASGAVTVTVAKGTLAKDGSLILDSDFVPLASGARYLIFLRQSPVFVGVFSPPVEPFRFRIDGVAKVESGWSDAPKFFPSRSLAQLLADVRSAAGAR